MEKRTIGAQALRRYPLYLRQLINLHDAGETHASAAALARLLKFDPILVRKDLAQTGQRGTPRIGFELSGLIAELESILGVGEDITAVLVGCGKLGSALLNYPGFPKQGLRIVAAFDAKPERCDLIIDGTPVFPVNTLVETMMRIGVQIGILTVPAEQAQRVADLMIIAGVKAIWNFTPTQIVVPDEIIVKREDLAVGLALLIHRLTGE